MQFWIILSYILTILILFVIIILLILRCYKYYNDYNLEKQQNLLNKCKLMMMTYKYNQYLSGKDIYSTIEDMENILHITKGDV